LQVELAASFAIVGRLDFDRDDDLAAYVDKVIRLERSTDPVPRAEAVVLGVDWGPSDVTSLSRRFMAEPIADQIDGSPPFRAQRLFGEEARKAGFVEAVQRGRPALVYSVGHGLFADPSEGIETQERVKGSICCARSPGEPVADWTFGVEDVPVDDAEFCHGGLAR
jgi:hypothetical protein